MNIQLLSRKADQVTSEIHQLMSVIKFHYEDDKNREHMLKILQNCMDLCRDTRQACKSVSVKATNKSYEEIKSK